MRKGTVVNVTADDRKRLAAIVANRNSPQKHVWRARIVLLTADGFGTAAVMRQTGKRIVAAKPSAAFDSKWGSGPIDPGFFARLVYEGV